MRRKQQDVDLQAHEIPDKDYADAEMGLASLLSIIEDVPSKVFVIMGILFNVHKVMFERALREIGLTRSQVMVMAYLYKNQNSDREITSHELERIFHVSNPTMSGILKRLEKKGKIKRLPARNDKRSKQLLLEENTDLFFKHIEEHQERAKGFLFQGITDEEMNNLEMTLEKLLYNMEQNIKEYDR